MTFLGVVLAFICCAIIGDKKDTFRFVFMTDIHVQPELRADEGFKSAIAKVNSLQPQPDFVITGGDLVFDVLGETFERADSLYNLYVDVCKNFTMPVYHCIGNHELFGVYEESGVDLNHPEFGKRMFRNRLGNGRTYRSFNHKGWHFILLDAMGITKDRHFIGKVDSVQLQWLKSDLATVDKSTPIAVALHIPLMTLGAQLRGGALAALSRSAAVTNSKEVENALSSNNLRLILQGHTHIVEEIILRDVHILTGGSVCGAWWKGPYDDFPEGFVVIDVKQDNFTCHYETFGWQAIVE